MDVFPTFMLKSAGMMEPFPRKKDFFELGEDFVSVFRREEHLFQIKGPE
jgi:hypothetical protein